jgi:uncharacterized protein with HEPN domain
MLPPEERDPAYLWEMRAAARRAWKYGSEALREQIEAATTLRYALAHVLEKLGRFAARVSPGFRSAHPDLPWERLAALENELAPVVRVDAGRLWNALRENVPGLAERLDALVPPVPEGDEALADSTSKSVFVTHGNT